MNANHIRRLVQAHKQKYRSKELPIFAKIERFYNNEFFERGQNRSSSASLDATDPRTTVNIIFATVETAKTLLLGQDIAIAANGHTPEAHAVQMAVSRLVTEQFRANNMRCITGITIDNALTKRRGIFKTTFSQEQNKALIFSVDPADVGYDPEAKIPSRSRFWYQCNRMNWRTFKQFVKSGIYRRPGKASDTLYPDKTPTWGKTKQEEQYADEIFGIALVWEFYDMVNMRAYHWHETTNSILWEGPIDDQPLAMYSLNHNLRNLDGISELELVLDQQEAINNVYTTMHQTMHRMLGRMLVDSSIVDPAEIGKAYNSPAGSYNHINMRNAQGKSLKDAFFQLPTATFDPRLPEFSSLMMANAQYITGVNAQARGMAKNVRTAAEVANMEAFSRDRIAWREGNLRDALSQVGERVVRLIQKYGEGPYTIKDQDTFQKLDQIDLNHFHGHFDIAPYAPVKSNPQMLADIIGRMGNFLVNNPTIPQAELTQLLLESLGLPLNAQQVKQQAQPPSMEQVAAAADEAAAEDPAQGAASNEQVTQRAQEL